VEKNKSKSNIFEPKVFVCGEITKVCDDFCSVVLRSDLPKIASGTHITFSLKDWQGNSLPRCGQVVTLEQITLFRKGWRSLFAAPIQIEV